VQHVNGGGALEVELSVPTAHERFRRLAQCDERKHQCFVRELVRRGEMRAHDLECASMFVRGERRERMFGAEDVSRRGAAGDEHQHSSCDHDSSIHRCPRSKGRVVRE
jgi:hypothetical protein